MKIGIAKSVMKKHMQIGMIFLVFKRRNFYRREIIILADLVQTWGQSYDVNPFERPTMIARRTKHSGMRRQKKTARAVMRPKVREGETVIVKEDEEGKKGEERKGEKE